MSNLGVGDVLSFLSFLGDESKYFVNSSLLPYWQQAFTHESINLEKNYEKFEFLGDVTMGYGFKIYLMMDCGIVEPSLLNNLQGYYLSKRYQPIMARKLGFPPFIAHHPKVDLANPILEDVMEAFFGVITLIARKRWLSDPSKYGNVYPIECARRFFQWYFKHHDTLDLKNGRVVDQTFFTQLYYFFSGESTERGSSWSYNESKRQLWFSPKFFQGVGNYSKELEKELRKIYLQRDSLDKLLFELIETFNKNGFDRQWYSDENIKISFKEDYPELSARIRSYGFKRAILSRNEHNSYDLLLQGVDPTTRKSISHLINRFFSDDVIEIKRKSADILESFDFGTLPPATE